MRALDLRRLLVATVALVLCAGPLSAASYTVNTIADTHAVDPVSGPNDAGGNVSLRSALEAADVLAGPHTVTVPPGTYTLTLGELVVGNAINANTTVTGTPAATIVRQTTLASRVFDINPLVDASVTVTLSGLTITGGTNPSDGLGGAGILAGGPGNVLAVSNCVITGNTDNGGAGGGINFTTGGQLIIAGSTISNNLVTSAAVGQGGGVFFDSNGLNAGGVTVTSSIFSGNQSAFPGVGGAGAGIFFNGTSVAPANLLSISKSAFVNNQAVGGFGGAIAKSIGNLTIQLSRIAGNSATTNAAAGVYRTPSGAGTVTIDDNWWGCNGGPGSTCSSTANGASTTPARWLQLRHSASPASINVTQTSTLTADLFGRNAGGPLTPGTLDGLPSFPTPPPPPAVFSNVVKGALSGTSTQFVNGQATATFTAGTLPGAGSADATADGQTITANISIFANTTTTVGSSVNPSVFGETVTFTAVVMPSSPATGTPAGSVQFVIDGVPVGTVTLASGSAAFTTSTLTVSGSPHSVSANYLGAGGYNPSSGALVGGQTVNKASTTAAIVSDTPDPSVVGGPVTVTYSVTPNPPGGGTPTGTVTVTDGTVSCTGTLPAPSCSLVLTGVGPHTLTAKYNGDSNFIASPVSAGEPHTVGKANTTATITSDPDDPSVVGQPVSVSYSVSVDAPGAGTPTGTVTVTDGVSSCTGTLPTPSCSITLTTAGVRSLTATYSGDSSFNASPASAVELHTVNKADTTASITADPSDPSVTGEPVSVSYAVTVDAPGAGTPTGTVTVTDGISSCTGTLPTLSCSITLTTAGVRSLTATYNGDARFNVSPASAIELHTVNKADTTTTITADAPDPSAAGQAVTVSYTVTVNSPGSGTPTGNVTVTDGTDSCIGTVATGGCSITFTSPGSKTVTATYGGDANYNASPASAGASHTVVPANTTTVITGDSPDPSVTGQAITVSYTVTPAFAGTATGSVTVSDGVNSCTATVAAGNCTLTLFTAGSRPLTAVYGGDASFNGSTSVPEPHTVDKANTTAAITSDTPDPSAVGEPVVVNYTVTVNSPGSGTPTGNVTVTDGTDSCTGTVAAGTCTITLTSAGNHTLTATYAGDASYNASPASAGESHVVGLATTTTTITSTTPNPSVLGQAVTISYTVTVNAPGVGTPTGNVTVTDGVGSCTATVGAGSCAITFTVSGPHVLIATYEGDANFATSTSAPFIHNVAFPNDTSATAKDVFLGSVSTDTIGPAPADHNWFRYSVQAGRSYCVEVDNGKSDTTVLDPFLSVYQADGTTLVGTNDNTTDEPGGPLLSRVCYIAAASEDNLADVTAALGGTSGAFRVRVVDTTVFSPGFFAGNGFEAFILIKNTTSATHNVTVTLLSTDGSAIVPPQSGVVAPNGNYNLQISQPPPLGFGVPSAAGGILIAHDGPPGSLISSVLSMSFTSGVSFDTPASPRLDYRR